MNISVAEIDAIECKIVRKNSKSGSIENGLLAIDLDLDVSKLQVQNNSVILLQLAP